MSHNKALLDLNNKVERFNADIDKANMHNNKALLDLDNKVEKSNMDINKFSADTDKSETALSKDKKTPEMHKIENKIYNLSLFWGLSTIISFNILLFNIKHLSTLQISVGLLMLLGWCILGACCTEDTDSKYEQKLKSYTTKIKNTHKDKQHMEE